MISLQVSVVTVSHFDPVGEPLHPSLHAQCFFSAVEIGDFKEEFCPD